MTAITTAEERRDEERDKKSRVGGKVKDTSVCLLFWSRWPGSSGLDQRPGRWAGTGSHGAPSGIGKTQTHFNYHSHSIDIFRVRNW